MDPRIKLRLAKVSTRLQSVRTGWSLAWLWLLAALCGWFLIAMLRSGWPVVNDSTLDPESLRDRLVIGWLAAVVAMGLVLIVLVRFRRPDYSQVVNRIERHFPDLEQRLLTASQIPIGASARPAGYLQRCVVSEAIRHDVQHGWLSLVSTGRMASAWLAHAVAFLSLLATAWLLWTTPANMPSIPILSNATSLGAVAAPIVEPGNTEIERGSSLIVTARFDQQIAEEVWLVQSAAASHGVASHGVEGNFRMRMRPSLDDPIFAAYLVSVSQPLDYHIEYGERVTPSYHVEVFDVPALVRADAQLVYPTYARQSDRSVLDTRRITVPAGTQVTWKLQLNKAVAVAELIGADGVTIPLLPADDLPTTVAASLLLQESQQWQVRLVDAQGRSNAGEIRLQANVLPNESAKIQMLAGGDARVSPLEEFEVSAQVSDDHAITSAGLAYQFGGGEVVETIVNASDLAGVARSSGATADGVADKAVDKAVENSQQLGGNQRQVSFSQRIDLETLAAQPNQLLSYYVWAEDVGPDGEPRRTLSDMYFAEVRPFEEIFREGQQPTSEQQQQQQAGDPQTEELVELQKQIVVATWNLLRSHRGADLPQTAVADLELLVESQESAAQLLEEKAADVQDPQLQTYVDQAAQSMSAAIDRLSATGQTQARAELQAALSHEQAAYEALLQLQSREHDVVRGQQSQSQSASSSSSARQAQIEQLALSNDENRYENERLAQSQEQEQQSEARQINSRLRELAARQQDLNQQLRELQAALQAAQTVEEQAELERRLQRLREQQQQMLADSDELNERMQKSANESMQQAQADMQQARDSMQRANEALRQDEPGKALAAGARAEQQMSELQESLREQSANQFQQSLQEMQRQAAGMEQKQNELARQLQGKSAQDEPASESTQAEVSQNSDTTPQSAGLRGEEPAQQEVADALRQQQSDLQELLQQMEQTVNDAEATEPLLAQRLYDSYRRMQQNKTLERLQVTERLVERNLQEPARELAQTSAEELAELRQQIDSAADAVLGSDVESLRLALSKLETLADALESESMWPDAPPSVPPTPPSAPSGQEQSQPTLVLPGARSSNSPTQKSPQEPAPQDTAPPAQEAQPQSQTQTAQGPQSLRGGQSQSPPSQSSGQPSERQQPGASRPLTGDGFREWSDTLRDVEELVGDAELRWQATEIRQAARELRSELKKHAAEPQWEAVQELVASPLRELKHKVADELIRRAADKTQIVPLDRDPVPSEFSRSVRQYFENLGSGQ